MPDTRSPHEDGDFTGYVGVRWPSLVRTLVLLGCPAVLAPDVVATGLGRCRRGWRAAEEHDDLDVVVHRAVLEAWDQRLRSSGWWAQLRPVTDSDWPLPDLAALDRLTPEVRTGLVLRRFTGLDAAQAVAVAGREAGGPLPTTPDGGQLRAWGDALVVYAPPDEAELTGAGQPSRSRRGLVTGVGVLAVVLLLGGWTWWAQRGDDGTDVDPVALETVEPTRTRNSSDVAWYAEGVLHLANATYQLPTLRDLAVLGAGAVYGDDEGRVVSLADDGSRTLLGTKDPAVGFAVSDAQGWVVWVDPAGANPRLLVYDLAQADIAFELDLPASTATPQEEPDTRPVAIDQDTIYYLTSEGARSWRPSRDPNTQPRVDPETLIDVASANRMFQLDDKRVALDQPFFNLTYAVPGRGGGLSEDGNYAYTRSPSDGSVLVYDTRSGEPVPVQPPEPLSVADVVLAPAGAITYVTIDPDAFPSQDGSDSSPVQGEIVTCQLDSGDCDAKVSFVLDSEAPILAH